MSLRVFYKLSLSFLFLFLEVAFQYGVNLWYEVIVARTEGVVVAYGAVGIDDEEARDGSHTPLGGNQLVLLA